MLVKRLIKSLWFVCLSMLPFHAGWAHVSYPENYRSTSLQTESQQAPAEDGFLSGFLTVPLLAGYVEIESDERLVFDTPSGIVAETRLSASDSALQMIKTYHTSLVALGWRCAEPDTSMICHLNENQLILKSEKPIADRGVIAIRIEPLKD